ncbi:hypothetical protein OPV22_013525 [Ensete ventricosum]|uniref:Uncharacterized protein n=1 Tax=Ensete ventricosum TaxID=4639 RepID=A0AAV8R125_ENSVE|nr:hypothetical protein OPV22_013525 [Ensete ventricosum]
MRIKEHQEIDAGNCQVCCAPPPHFAVIWIICSVFCHTYMIAKEQTEIVDACSCNFSRSYSLFYLTLLIPESAYKMMSLPIPNYHQDSATIHNKVSESSIEQGEENKKQRQQHKEDKCNYKISNEP